MFVVAVSLILLGLLSTYSASPVPQLASESNPQTPSGWIKPNMRVVAFVPVKNVQAKSADIDTSETIWGLRSGGGGWGGGNWGHYGSGNFGGYGNGGYGYGSGGLSQVGFANNGFGNSGFGNSGFGSTGFGNGGLGGYGGYTGYTGYSGWRPFGG